MDDDELLVMRADTAHPLVEEELPSGAVHDRGELGLRFLAEAEGSRVGPPEQTPDVDAAARQLGEDAGDGRTLVPQFLVVVATPVDDAHEVAGAHGLERLGDPSEIRLAVDQRRDAGGLGPRLFADERGPRTLTLAGEEPGAAGSRVSALVHGAAKFGRGRSDEATSE